MSFYTEVIQPHHLFHTTDCVRRMDLLEPATAIAVNNIISGAEKLNVSIFLTETYRSAERQAMLFEQGATKLQHVGVHHYGLAVDFAMMKKGKAHWDGDWSFLGALAKRYGMMWGGDWGNPEAQHDFCDKDHIQRVTLAQQDRLFAGLWYPDSNTLLDPSICG